jgi:hypothetical protein
VVDEPTQREPGNRHWRADELGNARDEQRRIKHDFLLGRLLHDARL